MKKKQRKAILKAKRIISKNKRYKKLIQLDYKISLFNYS
jgi:hypothetical protein